MAEQVAVVAEMKWTVEFPRVVSTFFIALLVSLAWADALADQDRSEKPEDWIHKLEMLRALPYVGSSSTSPADSQAGVVFHRPEKAHAGYNFYSSPDAGEAILMDMGGDVVHRWTFSPLEGGICDHVVLLGDGDIILINGGRLLRLNWDGQLIWEKALRAHHDIAVLPDGSLYTIGRHSIFHRNARVWFDALVHLAADGEVVERWSTYDHLAELRGVLDTRSFLDTLLDSIDASAASGEHQPSGRENDGEGRPWRPSAKKFPPKYDYFHANTVSLFPATPLGEDDSRFRPGNLLLCFRNVNQIAVLDKDIYQVLWAWGEGDLQRPHHPTVLENGHILIFDNGIERQYSRVLELDPLSQEILWEYAADPPEEFYSPSRGSAQRLSNGNTLICESDRGRAFEVTEQGEMVWVWLNPAVKDGKRMYVYRMLRIPGEQVLPSLSGRSGE